MKQKELKNLAKRIAEQEKIFRNPNITPEQKLAAENEIITLSSKVKTLGEIDQLDEYIQEYLKD